ncbi:hypothetical protein FJ364_00400 [Candidatus Dependentiae bacterium]|nr:hypothetical protein [Candidatus Dependentiae bacterium]
MRKIVKLYSLTLIFLVFSSNSKAASTESGKSFFMPQPLTAMLVPLSMRPQLIMHGNADAQKSTIVHLRPLATQPEYVPPFQVPPFSSPQPLYAPQQPSVKYEKIEQLSTTEGATEPAQAMPLENVTIPLNEVESPEALTIPLNEIVEPRMVPGSLSYDAPNLYEQPNFLTKQCDASWPDASASWARKSTRRYVCHDPIFYTINKRVRPAALFFSRRER